MNRRTFLQAVASTAVAASSPLRAQSPRPRIDAARLRQELETLSAFGRPAGKTFAEGVSRVAYSNADVAGRQYVTGLMREVGLPPRIDPAGNIFGVRKGQDATLRPILFGSHIDSVPQGGNFDGDLGSLAAIESIRALNAANIVTRHPLEVVIWAHEEGGTFPNALNGSRAVVGQLVAGELDQVFEDLRKADGIRRIGGDPDRIAEARRQPGSIHCYLELHIEQGGTLDRQHLQIGVVEGIVSISRFTATVTGFANHAGTTMMADRQDALVAASELVIAVREEVTRVDGRQVGTVGHIELTPNAENVIPGKAVLIDRTARSVGSEADVDRGRHRGAGTHDRRRDKNHDRDRTDRPLRSGAGDPGDPVRHRARGLPSEPLTYPAAQRRRPRRTDGRDAWSDGHDLRAQHRRCQSTRRSSAPSGTTAPAARTCFWGPCSK